MTIDSDDTISRFIIHDRAFQDGVHLDEALFIFGQTGPDGRSHESGVLRRLCPLDEDVHTAGCGVAASQNARRKSQQAKRRYYCGFRSASLSNMTLNGDGFQIFLTLDGEDGFAAHVDIALLIDGSSVSERASIKADAGMTLAEAFGHPIAHICDCDRADDQHPLILNPECLSAGLVRLVDLSAKNYSPS